MPLNFWQPKEDVDPTAAANSGKMNGEVQSAMEMARTLALKKIPMIISVWSGARVGADAAAGWEAIIFRGRAKIESEKV